ncbi:MAG: YggU family protein [Desulfuromonadales bacterium GWD2_61_12]|nr:MAG: YggU family protein [Desulfuromonadales bacterium GWC2_61_20]OGR32677.1 MAG: YggU family protein [Desulfuromonadales bacterium GWD2_61_12]HAD04974.1 YggU family protein [Desulfuromonas sp.]HBT83596.1 YggU family protein [Desulfuromonas sp.]
MSAWLEAQPGGVLIRILVQPRASKNEIVGVHGEELKVRLTSPPVEGAANRLCCEFIAKRLGVAKGMVDLAAGETSRHKRLLVRGVDTATVLRRLGDG